MSLESEFVIKNTLIASKISKRIDSELSIHGISCTEYLVMHHLDGSLLKTMRRIDLAELVGISPSGVTRLILPMEKIGIVEKVVNPRDARQSLVKLTEAGEQLYNDASQSFIYRSKELLQALTKNQIQHLIELFNKLK